MLGWRKDGSSIKKLLRRHSLRTVEEASWDKLTGRGRKVLKKIHLTEEKKAEEQKEDKDEKEEIFFMCQLSQSPKRVVHFLFTSQEERKKGKEGLERHPSGKICPPLRSQGALPTGHSLTAFSPLPRPTLSRSNCLGSQTEPPPPLIRVPLRACRPCPEFQSTKYNGRRKRRSLFPLPLPVYGSSGRGSG